jgi:hypothetical protein
MINGSYKSTNSRQAWASAADGNRRIKLSRVSGFVVMVDLVEGVAGMRWVAK